MIDADEIAQKRAEMRQQKAAEGAHKESINAVTDSGKEVVEATGRLAKSQDIDKLLEQVKELTLAQYMGGQKQTVVLTDQTDLGDKMGELATKVENAIKQLDNSETDKQQITELKSLYTGLTQLKSAFESGNKDVKGAIATLSQAVA